MNHEFCFVISTYTKDQSVIDLTEECINSISGLGYTIILTSHYPIPINLQNISDYSIYDTNNIVIDQILDGNLYNINHYSYDHYECLFNWSDQNYSFAILSNYRNGAVLANNIGIQKIIFLNFDLILNQDNIGDFNYLLNMARDKRGLFQYDNRNLWYGSNFFILDVDIFLSLFIEKDTNSYNNFCLASNRISNNLENYLYKKLSISKNLFVIMDTPLNNIFLNNINTHINPHLQLFETEEKTDDDNDVLGLFLMAGYYYKYFELVVITQDNSEFSRMIINDSNLSKGFYVGVIKYNKSQNCSILMKWGKDSSQVISINSFNFSNNIFFKKNKG